MYLQVHSDLTQLLEEVRRDQPMGLLLARAGVSREVFHLIISTLIISLIEVITVITSSASLHIDQFDLCDHESKMGFLLAELDISLLLVTYMSMIMSTRIQV